MGDAKRRQISDADFLKTQPECVYCGQSPSTIEHFPPRAFFENRIWPEGFRFASCTECNAKTRHEDQVVSFLAGLRLQDGPWDAQTLRLFEGIKNNRPDVCEEWFDKISRNELRRRLRTAFGPEQGDKWRRRGLSIIHYGPMTHQCFKIFGLKLMTTLYFKHFGRRCDGVAFARHQSMIDQKASIEAALELAPQLTLTSRNNRSLSGQFVYRFAEESTEGALFVVAQLGPQLGYVGHAFSKSFWEGREGAARWQKIDRRVL